MSNIIDQLISNGPDRLLTLLREAHDEIAESLVQAAADAKENDTQAKVSIPFTMALNIDKNEISYALTVTRKSKWQTVEEVDNKDQGRLPLEGAHVTVKAGGKEIFSTKKGAAK